MTRFDLFIDGRFVAPASGRYFPTEDPYLGETWAEVADAGDEDVELAVDAAARAFRESWRRTSGGERARSMRRLGDLVLRDQEELARMEVRDNAKSIGEMRGQLRNTAEWYYYYG
ncbi:MAG: aldehyde dehydrogenase family protein, partial [Gemmatimonadales bacterium]|nr:aldehyde dehydrogenase family protein [Gemmatimonadales bacterium]